MKKVSLMFVVLLLLCGSIQAGVIVTTDADASEYDKVYELWTGDSSNGNFSDSAAASMAQTITIGAGGLVVEDIHLIYEAASDVSVTLHIFEVADVAAATIDLPVGPTELTETFIVPTSAGRDALHIALDTPVTLAADTGYAIYIRTDDSAKTFKWRRSGSTANDFYAGGVFYDEGAIKNAGARDGLVAFNVVPEPTTMALLGMGGLVSLLKRKRS